MLNVTKRAALGLLAILLTSLVLVWMSYVQKTGHLDAAKQQHIQLMRDSTAIEMRKLQDATRHIYENLRLLATLPGLESIDRHGANASSDVRATFQHVYNNLANAVKVSEVYIVPIDFAPAKIDPTTGKLEEPIMMFDSLILNSAADVSLSERLLATEKVQSGELAGAPEVEDFEYAELVKQAAWFKSKYPHRSAISVLDFPMIGSSEVITCDNSDFNLTAVDADRSGVIMSVPFFDPSGNLKGMVSAIILSSALVALLPHENSALISSGNQYLKMGAGALQMPQSHAAIRATKPDTSLIYSEVVDLSQIDGDAPWSVWVGQPDTLFWNSATVENTKTAFNRSVLAIFLVTSALLAAYFLFLCNLEHAKSLNRAMAVDHQLALTQQSEAEARERIETLNQMNEKVISLNADLEHNIVALKSAQDEVVAKSKMAQLGQLVATVAHEIRNPLGGVRTSAFLLKRRLGDAVPEIQVALQRIENGISRCDKIITQLLDFSRSNLPVTKKLDVDDWMLSVIQELSSKLPTHLTVNCDLGMNGQSAEFDPDRMERVMANLVTNASDAMIDPKSGAVQNPNVAPTIWIKTESSEDDLKVTVSDNGPGIPKEFMAKIREPLFTTKSFGTGLGIPAVEKVIELHGGKLFIHSADGQGAAFSFTIPKVNVQRDAA